MGYSQRDPKWRNHPLGYGPALGTIGEFGCFDTTLAMVATWAGWPINPAQIDEAMVAHGGIFQRDPTGTFDYLPDNALALLWPDRFAWVGSWAGLRSDLIAAALPSPDEYVMLYIHSAAVPMHFVPVVGGSPPNWTIDDSWDDAIKSLNNSYGSGSISKTIIVRALNPVAKPAAQPAPAAGPVVIAPPVAVIVPPEPMALYSFQPQPPDDLHPADQVTTLADAKSQADTYAGMHPQSSIDVIQVNADESGNGRGSTDRVVYHLDAGVVPG
jgi:hypothetical protein